MPWLACPTVCSALLDEPAVAHAIDAGMHACCAKLHGLTTRQPGSAIAFVPASDRAKPASDCSTDLASWASNIAFMVSASSGDSSDSSMANASCSSIAGVLVPQAAVSIRKPEQASSVARRRA